MSSFFDVKLDICKRKSHESQDSTSFTVIQQRGNNFYCLITPGKKRKRAGKRAVPALGIVLLAIMCNVITDQVSVMPNAGTALFTLILALTPYITNVTAYIMMMTAYRTMLMKQKLGTQKFVTIETHGLLCSFEKLMNALTGYLF